VSDRSLGIAYVSLDALGTPRMRFRTFDLSLGEPAAPVDLPISTFANAPSVAFAGGRFVVAWGFTFDSSVPGAAIHVATVEEGTNAVSGGNPVTFGFSFARHQSLVSLGDRVFLSFSAAGADGAYDIYGLTLAATLDAPPPSTRLTSTPAASLFPYAARGPAGSIGIVFEELVETPPTSRRPHILAVGCPQPVVR
jgi:hypothetical protein